MGYFEKATLVLKTIESLGFQAYIVGGAVRDYLLGIETNDIDMTTNMPANELKKHFNVIDNGSDYESVTIVIDGYSFEITHFRRDIAYTDHRHPIVELVDNLYEDTLRRDFTINALAMDSDYDIIDYHNGINDLNNGIIRAIGNPSVRFDEDALRILRGLHFSSKLDLKIEDNTLNAMVEKKELLAVLSETRMYDYFIKIIYSKTNRGIDYINKYDLFSNVLVFKKWLDIFDKKYKQDDLEIIYYLKYREMPLSNKRYENTSKALESIIDSGFDEYEIYTNLDIVKNNINLLNNLGYDTKALENKIESLSIKNDNELAVSKSEIASLFVGNKKSEAIKAVINEVVHSRLNNNRASILAYLKER